VYETVAPYSSKYRFASRVVIGGTTTSFAPLKMYIALLERSDWSPISSAVAHAPRSLTVS
jgi:hypothetical protein